MSSTSNRVRYIPFKVLEEGWSYISVDGGKHILKLRFAITKAEVQLNEKGDPVLDPSGKPVVGFGGQYISVLLTAAEYEVDKKMAEFAN